MQTHLTNRYFDRVFGVGMPEGTDTRSGIGERELVCEPLGFRVQGSGFRVQGSGFRVTGARSRIGERQLVREPLAPTES